MLENAMEILDGMQTEGKIRDLTLLVALFHDVGRFHQYLTYKTFLDSVSLNHGVLGSKILGTTDLLQGLSPEERQMMRASVCLHNRKILPTHISPMLRFMTRVVRDADKIDIIRVMLEHFSAPEGHPVVVLHVKNEPDSFTDSVYEDVWHARRGDYRKLKFVNDFKLMLCGWVHDLNFAPSRNILIRRGLLEQMLEDPSRSRANAAPGHTVAGDPGTGHACQGAGSGAALHDLTSDRVTQTLCGGGTLFGKVLPFALPFRNFASEGPGEIT